MSTDSNSVAGRSALREYERRRTARRSRAREWFGAVGAVVAGLIGEPQSTRAWKQGAEAERHVATVLERRLRGHHVVLLHDRQIRHGGNIDHLAVGPAGVTVIDTKASRARIALKTVGGRFNGAARKGNPR